MPEASPYAAPPSKYRMRQSRVLRAVREGRVARVLKINTVDAKVAEIFAEAQPDAIWVCMEHVSTTWEQAENQIRAAKIHDVDTLLRVSRGGLDDLEARDDEELAGAIHAALLYDRAVCAAYGVVASRRNYDVIVGRDASGQRHCGVLEQSWRFGGASMAELLALECLAADGGTAWVLAETVESYDGEPDRPGAVVYWPGDARSPRKYARVIASGC